MDAVCKVKRLHVFRCIAGQDFSVKQFDFGPYGKWFNVKHYKDECCEFLKCQTYGFGILGSSASYGKGPIYIRKGGIDWWSK